MTRSARFLAFVLLVEASLATLWYWLVAGIRSGELPVAVSTGQAITTISASIGGTMGLLAGLALAFWALTKRHHHAG
jgi:hypothetical protein